MSYQPLFQLGAVLIPAEAVLDFSQSYEPLGDGPPLRTMTGAAIKQAAWAKLRTTLAGGGWWPAALEGLDYSQPLTLKCAQQRAVHSASNVIVLPAARRTDAGYTPVGHAIGADGRLVPTPLNLVVDTATLTTVAGALGYQVAYWPQLTVYAEPPRPEMDVTAAQHRWVLTAEEA